MNRFTFVVAGVFLNFSSLFCQQNASIFNQVIGSSGRTAVHQGRTFAYTVGEPVIWTGIGVDRIATQGFHQPEQTRLVYVGEPDLSSWNIAVFPNPTEDRVNIRFSGEAGAYLLATVLDAAGRIMLQGERLTDGTVVDCSAWQPGIYFLTLRDPKTRAFATTRIIRL